MRVIAGTVHYTCHIFTLEIRRSVNTDKLHVFSISKSLNSSIEIEISRSRDLCVFRDIEIWISIEAISRFRD
jgi:hypothetical protein